MRRLICITVVALGLFFARNASAAVVTPDVFMQSCFAAGPNAFGSPDFGAFVQNAQAGVDVGCISFGTPGDAAFFNPLEIAPASDFIATGYGDLGRRQHAALKIESGTAFSLSGLSFDMSSTDPANSLAFAGNFAGSTYSANRVGINYGADLTRGTSDDITYNSGESADLIVNLLLYVGVGNAFAAYNTAEYTVAENYLLTNGGNLDPFILINNYALRDPNGNLIGVSSAEVAVAAAVPEPATISLAGFGLVALYVSRRRNKRR